MRIICAYMRSSKFERYAHTLHNYARIVEMQEKLKQIVKKIYFKIELLFFTYSYYLQKNWLLSFNIG